MRVGRVRRASTGARRGRRDDERSGQFVACGCRAHAPVLTLSLTITHSHRYYIFLGKTVNATWHVSSRSWSGQNAFLQHLAGHYCVLPIF